MSDEQEGRIYRFKGGDDITAREVEVKHLTGESRLYIGDEAAPKKFDFNGGTLYMSTGHVPKINKSGFWRRLVPVSEGGTAQTA